MAIYTITLSSGSGAVTSIDTLYVRKDSTFNYDFAYRTYENAERGYPYDFDTITPPTWTDGTRIFSGYYDDSGNLRISNQGNIILHRSYNEVPFVTSSGTWTASWIQTVFVCTIEGNGGAGGTEKLYWHNGTWYLDEDLTEVATTITRHRWSKHNLMGYYATTSGGTKYISSAGTLLSAILSLTPTEDFTIYARWRQGYKITLNGQTVWGASPLYAFTSGGESFIYDNEYLENKVNSIPVPSRECFTFNGVRSANNDTSTLYITTSGDFTSEFKSLSFSRDITIYIRGIRISWYISLVNKTTEIGHLYSSVQSAGIYSDDTCTIHVSSISIPQGLSRPTNEAFSGFFASSTSSETRLIDDFGRISSTLQSLVLSEDLWLYAQWRSTDEITLEKNGGSGGDSEFFVDTCSDGSSRYLNASGFFITSVSVPVRDGFAFNGYSSSGITRINSSGLINNPLGTIDRTFTAQWRETYLVITIDPDGGTSQTSRIYYKKTGTQGLYSDPGLTTPISSITPPTKDGFVFDGCFNSDGVEYIGQDGVFTSDFTSARFTSSETITARWHNVSYKISFDLKGATGTSEVFYRVDGGGIFEDRACTTQISGITPPSLAGHTFVGAYSADTTSSSKYVNANGTFTSTFTSLTFSQDSTAYCQFTERTYTLSFNGNGAIPSFSSKSVTFGHEIGALPTVSYPGKTFLEWSMSGSVITPTTVYQTAGNSSALAIWQTPFGDVRDYFSLGNAWLVPESSDSGDNRQRVAVRHYGKTEADVSSTSGVWRNPSVTYRVVSNGTLNVTLGKAFSGSSGVSGFMITSVSVATKLGEFPTVTVSATANEGRDAINSFTVSFQILGRARPQKLMTPFSGGGELQELTLVASCDPVVVAENMMPCASDVVNGRITVNATTCAYNNEAEPTASNGFAQVGAPIACGGTAYKQWRINLIKEI